MIALIDRAEAIIGKGRIVNNQVEVHPYLQNLKLRRHCASKGIAVTAYLPLARGRTATDPVLCRIGAKHGATGAQVSLAFLMQEGLIVIPATGRTANLAENLDALKIRLEEADLQDIRLLESAERLINPATAPVWD